MKKKKLLIWSNSISDLLDGNAYGIAVQLYFWAQTFVKHGWQVTTLTHHKDFDQEGILFIHKSNWGKIEILHDWMGVFWKLLTLRPQIVISRGADRVAYPLAVFSRLFGVKYVFFGASDVNFEPGKELMAGGSHNRKLWQKAVKKMDHIVVQNKHQHDTLQVNYDKESLVLFNIWGEVNGNSVETRPTDVVWVANYRPLKRPEWIIDAARVLPNVDFTMVGGASDDKQYYEKIKETAQGIPNLHFLGPRSFMDTNAIVSKARVLCCTSTFEGFPNTFLQAWASGIPVISTVDPSGVISFNTLGKVVDSYENFIKSSQGLLADTELYFSMCTNVNNYFQQNHSADTNFQQLMNYIYKEQENH